MNTSVILLGHGSRAETGNTALAEIAGMLKEMEAGAVIPAYLQFCSPSLTDAVRQAVAEGADRIIVVPYFLYSGNHVTQDIPEELDGLRAEYSQVEIIMTEHLGAHRKLAEIVIERIKKV